MKESIYGQNIDTQSGNSANVYPLLATYGLHSLESSLFYHYTLECLGWVLLHLSKYWTTSLLLGATHVFHGRSGFTPCTVSPRLQPSNARGPPCYLRASPGVCVADSYPERPAAVDGQFLISLKLKCLCSPHTVQRFELVV